MNNDDDQDDSTNTDNGIMDEEGCVCNSYL